MTFKVSVAAFRGGKLPPSAEATLSARIKLSIHVSDAPVHGELGESLRSPPVTEEPALLTTKSFVSFWRFMEKRSECHR